MIMKIKSILLICGVLMGLLASCADDESFSTSSSSMLTFSTDSVKIDTVFSNVPTATKSLWVYNRSGDGLRCRNVRLAKGGKSGFRVNVDGFYLGEKSDYQFDGVELRKDDSLRVFVELTSPVNHVEGPQLHEDELVFTLESGVEQRVNLSAYTWDALQLRSVRINKDSTISGNGRPIVIYGGIRVDSTATLNIAAGTTIYFHNDAGIDVFGRLRCNGTPDQPVVLRGDRIDKMFDYLPYDRVPGQWQGVRFRSSAHDNVLSGTDIHSTFNGIWVDSTSLDREMLLLENVTVHNCQGYGLYVENARVNMVNTQITNVLNDCVMVNGGDVKLTHCTLAQFYGFDSNRGFALHFSAKHPIVNLSVTNSLITGYADDLLMGEKPEDNQPFEYHFSNCIIRTPKVTTADSLRFENVIYEDLNDTLNSGRKHFVSINEDMLYYDFRLDSLSMAIDKGNGALSVPADHDGKRRDERPDVGAYEYVKP